MLKKCIQIGVGVCTLIISSTSSAFAQTTRLNNPIKSENFSDLITAIIDFVLFLATPILVIAIIAVGFQFVLAQGKEKELSKAKSNLWYTLIGAAIIIGVRLIQEVLQGTIGAIVN